jgi:hypothetical protein
MIKEPDRAGTFSLPGTSMTVNRMGYGAMQLAGPEVWGPPRDVDAAIAVLREAIDSGVNHIDTSDYYGPHITNQLIKRALHPYRKDLVIVTKVGARRGADKSWIPALSRQELIDGVHDNLRHLGLDRLEGEQNPFEPMLCRRFNPDLSSPLQTILTDAQSFYNSFQLKVSQRKTNRFWQASYVFSHSIDDSSNGLFIDAVMVVCALPDGRVSLGAAHG